MKHLALAFVFGLVCSAPVAAAPLYDNLAYGSGTGEGLVTAGPLANSFSTDASPFSFSALKLSLGVITEQDGGSATVSLLSDAGDMPGAAIAALGTVLNNDLTATFSVVAVSLKTIALSANTRYWISLAGTGSAQWEYASALLGTGVGGEFWANNTGVFSNDPRNTPYLMAIGPVDVPEPLTLSLLGAGLIGGAVLRRVARKA